MRRTPAAFAAIARSARRSAYNVDVLATDAPLTLTIDHEPGAPPAPDPAGAERLSLPLLALRGGGRLAVVASAALWRVRSRLVLTTAAHVFDRGLQVGDLGVADPVDRRIWWLGAHGARLRVHPESDVALIDLPDIRDFPLGWRALPAGLLHARPEPCDRYLMAGWPSAQTLWTGRHLLARPLLCLTTRHGPAGSTYRYGRIADRIDGTAVCTPALDGASGALLWRVHADAEGLRLQPAGMQVSFMHGRFMRCESLAPITELMDR